MTVPSTDLMRPVALVRRHVLHDANGVPIPPAQRWAPTLAEDRDAVKALVKAGLEEARKKEPDWLIKLATRVAYWGLTDTGDRWYVAEIKALAKLLGESPYDLALIQQQYTWVHLGCTVTAFWDKSRGEMVHLRSLDWDMRAKIAAATRLVECYARQGDAQPSYRALGIGGMVGLLTAVKPGAFSVSINYSPWNKAGYYIDPTIRLREVMDDPGVRDYASARAALSDKTRPVGAPVFYTLCGTQPHELCVIEWSGPALLPGFEGECYVREADHSSGNALIVQANHHDLGGPYAMHNPGSMPNSVGNGQEAYDCKLETSSVARYLALYGAVRQGMETSAGALASGWAAYRIPPLWNKETVHWAVMRPASGTIEAWAWSGT